MQNLAQTYGERHTVDYCIEVLANRISNADNKVIMEKCFRLFGADCIQRDLGFYLIQGVVSRQAADALTATRHELIRDIAARADDLLDCMNIPKHALYAPIAADYVKYNASPNFGEVKGARM